MTVPRFADMSHLFLLISSAPLVAAQNRNPPCYRCRTCLARIVLISHSQESKVSFGANSSRHLTKRFAQGCICLCSKALLGMRTVRQRVCGIERWGDLWSSQYVRLGTCAFVSNGFPFSLKRRCLMAQRTRVAKVFTPGTCVTQ